MKRRKIAVVTGSRADYGHLYWLMKEIQTDELLELQVIVTGMHLSAVHGCTYEEVIADGFSISDRVEMLLASDSAVATTKSLGMGVIGFADSLSKLQPDMLVVLGDRFEIFAAVQAALIGKIPVAHLHGGEATYGAFDESIRNAITKMSHLHFVAAPEYAARIKQMGENPELIFNYGAPGLDYVANIKLLDRNQFEEAIDFSLGKLTFLVTYHPVTLSTEDSEYGISQLIEALKKYSDAKIIFTLPNADTDSRKIMSFIKNYVQSSNGNSIFFESMGQLRYFSAVSHVDVVLGNSSSGLNEVPYFNKPTVNIGTRQQGRLYPPSVIQCDSNAESIVSAIDSALSFKNSPNANNETSINTLGTTSRKIKNKLKEVDLSNILVKRFHQGVSSNHE